MTQNQIFWMNLENIRATLRYDEDVFSSYMGLGFQEYSKAKVKQDLLPFHAIINIGDRLKFDYNELFTENFNINKILSQLSSGKKLDERYKVGTYTRPIVILNTLDHIERVKGVQAKAEIMNGFQLDLQFLMRNDVRLNILLNKDILSFLRARYKLNLDFFMHMGQTVADRLKDSAMAKGIASQKNVHQMLEHFVLECTPKFDENFHYTFKSLNHDFAIIEAVPRKNVLEELKISSLHFGNDPADFNRMGIFSAFSHFHFGRYAEVKRISDLLVGDKSSCYLIDLRPFQGGGRSSESGSLRNASYR